MSATPNALTFRFHTGEQRYMVLLAEFMLRAYREMGASEDVSFFVSADAKSGQINFSMSRQELNPENPAGKMITKPAAFITLNCLKLERTGDGFRAVTPPEEIQQVGTITSHGL